ncbi:MAG: filamentous hemagglutinin N-terminal domain-containing protein [Geminicoccaceae bacterium]
MSTDGSVGAAQTLSGPNYDIDAELGTQAGGNLFHSFQRFSICTGESATFSGPGNIDNIISRVTGGELSAVDGLLASTISGASLWLFNPAGVVFGPNASLDVSGSFHVSTADEVRFADGGRFSADDSNGNGFSVAPPESFGFLGSDPAGITIAGSQLEVGEGETLSVVGGDVDIAGASLATAGGDMNVLAAGGVADANVVTGDLTGAADGAVTIRADASLSSIGDGGGTIRIEGGEFVVDENSSIISANTGATDGDIGVDVDVKTAEIAGGSLVATNTVSDGKGGNIDIEADSLLVSGGSVATNSSAAGGGGDINITGGKVAFRDDGFTLSLAQGSGDGGSIDIAANDLTVTNGDITTGTADTASAGGGDITIAAASIELRAGGPDERSLIATNSFGSGASGDVDIRSGRVLAEGGGQLLGASIQSLSEGEGSRGGLIRLVVGSLDLVRGGLIFGESSGGSADTASIDVTADTINIDGSDAGLTGINLIANSQGTTRSAIVIRVGDLDIQNGGQIDSGTVGTSDAGDIAIIAESISLSSEGPGISSNISSDSSVGATGNAGRISIVANVIDLSGDATIRSAAFGQGDAGVIDIAARDNLSLRDTSQIDSRSLVTSTGDAGTIVVRTSDLSIRDASTISSSSVSAGNAGSIDITADTALIDRDGAEDFGGITTQAGPGSTGNAGDVNLTIGSLFLLESAQIDSSSFGAGNAGRISIHSDQILIDSQGDDGQFATSISTAVSSRDSSGDAGAIIIVADRMILRGDNAEIQSDNDGLGSAGTIDIRLKEGLVLDDGADIVTDSISAGGGDINIATDQYVVTTGFDSRITTTVADDSGNAGDIVIATPLLALGESRILAQADAGRGGDIQISTDDLILSPLAEINAEAGATGIDGTVAVSAAEVDLTGGLAALDGRFLDVASLLRERCAAKRAEDSSSFTLGTGGAVPSDLDAPRPSLLRAQPAAGEADHLDGRTMLVLPCPKAAS